MFYGNPIEGVESPVTHVELKYGDVRIPLRELKDRKERRAIGRGLRCTNPIEGVERKMNVPPLVQYAVYWNPIEGVESDIYVSGRSLVSIGIPLRELKALLPPSMRIARSRIPLRELKVYIMNSIPKWWCSNPIEGVESLFLFIASPSCLMQESH